MATWVGLTSTTSALAVSAIIRLREAASWLRADRALEQRVALAVLVLLLTSCLVMRVCLPTLRRWNR